MTGLATAVSVESLKTRSARVVWWTTALLVVGVTLLAIGTHVAIATGNPELIAKLGPVANAAGWVGLLSVVAQICAAGGLLAMGVVLSWLIGREYAEGTIGALFALPVSRALTASAKLLTYLAWVAGVAVGMTVVVLIVGLALGLGVPDVDALRGLSRITVLLVLTGLVATPAAWAATLGRGLLPGIATAVVLLVIAQVMAVLGVGAWFPVAAPALWVINPDSVTPVQLALVPLIPLLFGALTVVEWRRLQLDR